MSLKSRIGRQLRVHRTFAVRFLSLLVAAHGGFILAATLLDQLTARHGSKLSDIVIDVPLVIGLGLVYLATLLRRRKRSAWSVTLLAYVFYFGLTLSQLLIRLGSHDLSSFDFVRSIVLPLVIIGLLLLFEGEFIVRSDQQGFRWALRFVVIVLAAAFIYGVAGFTLLDRSDFHQEIGLATAAHYTIDQFDLTTNHPLHPATKRAHLFVDSLTFVSLAALTYAVISFFQPLRARFSDQTRNRERMTELLRKYHAPSEDFFKLWPHDKQYFFDETGRSGLAFHVYRGVALCLADPAGDPKLFAHLLDDFNALCFSNDWLPAFIHVQDTHHKLYDRHGFVLQKLGEEAVLDIRHFQSEVVATKYFRQVGNKFTKRGYKCELLTPPHHPAVLERLRHISDDWLARGGHSERGFVMGYYTDQYMDQCPVLVVRDAASTIQAFINLVPADFDRQEATFDMLRHASGSPGNINDFLLMNFIQLLADGGYSRLNLGLCPLAGLSDAEGDSQGMIDSFLRFAYANGDRFYSFSGVYRFKTKYEPQWRDRYIAYQGGLRGFSRTMNALMRCMRVRR